MRRPPFRVVIASSLVVLCIGSCGWLSYRLSAIYRTTPAQELRSCMDSVYDAQYCLGLVPTVQSIYPALYHEAIP